MSTWIEIGALDDIPSQGSRIVEGPEGNIAVIRTEDDTVFAIHDSCPHKQGPLSQGIVYGHKVACPLHNWSFDLASGQAQAPDEGHVACYPVKVDNGKVFLSMERSA
ncbi:MAG: nitrite reductase small subunit NirD [Magnetovibrio sp.]|nr:nitrite reductase small subunit NirD [Magnetovibrio sp.]